MAAARHWRTDCFSGSCGTRGANLGVVAGANRPESAGARGCEDGLWSDLPEGGKDCGLAHLCDCSGYLHNTVQYTLHDI